MGLIPARSGSKRVKDKNIRILDGQTLLQWSVVAGIFNRLIGWVVVSTDSPEYAEMAGRWGAEVIMRPPELAGDASTDQDVLRHAVMAYPEVELVAYLRPTTPLRHDDVLCRAIRCLLEAGENADSLRSVEEMPESAFKNFTFRPGPFLVPIGKDMDMANRPNHLVVPTYKGNGYIDVVKKSQVLRGDPWGSRCIGFLTPRTIEIDTEDDLEYAEWWIQRRRAQRRFGIE